MSRPPFVLTGLFVLLLSLHGCKTGWDNTDEDNDGDNGDNGDGSSAEHYFGPGPDNLWATRITSADNFTVNLTTGVNGTTQGSFGGARADFASGFSQFDTNTGSGSGSSANGTTLPALIADDSLLIMQSWTNELVTLIPDEQECRENDFNGNWVEIVSPSGKLANDEDSTFLGTLSYQVGTETATLQTLYPLTPDPISQNAVIVETAEEPCELGAVEADDNVVYMAGNETMIVHRNIDTGDESILLGLPDTPVQALSNLDGSNYAGFWVDNARTGDNRLWTVTAECTAPNCTVTRVTDWENASPVGQTFTLVFDEDGVDEPDAGFITGAVETVDESGVGVISGRLICAADRDFDDSGDKLLACVGQSPYNSQLTVNAFLISKD